MRKRTTSESDQVEASNVSRVIHISNHREALIYEISGRVAQEAIAAERKQEMTNLAAGESDARRDIQSAHQQMGYLETPKAPKNVIEAIEFALTQCAATILRMLAMLKENKDEA
jgi:hypothetical protein